MFINLDSIFGKGPEESLGFLALVSHPRTGSEQGMNEWSLHVLRPKAEGWA